MAIDDNLAPQAALTPVAEPVDTYVIPPRVEPSNLMELASGLKDFDGQLDAYVKAKQAQDDTIGQTQGQAAFYQNNQAGFSDAVSQGLIPAQASPAFVAGYKKAQGNLAGFDLQSRFAQAYDGWDGKNSDDPQAFTNFSSQFLKNNLGGNQDPAYLNGLMPHINQMVDSGMSKWVADQHKALYDGAIITNAALSAQAIETAQTNSLSTGQPVDYDGLFQTILQQRQQALATGVNSVDFDKQLVKTVQTEAIKTAQPQLLSFFNVKVPGQDYTFGQTPHGEVDAVETATKLTGMYHSALEMQHQQQLAQDKAGKAAATTGVLDLMSQNVNAPVPEALLQQGEKYDPEFRVHVADWQKALANGDVQSDKVGLLQLHSAIINGAGADAITAALPTQSNPGVIRNQKDLDDAYSLVKKVAEGGDPTQKVLQSRSTLDADAAIRGRAMSGNIIDEKLAGIGGITDQGLAAQYDFHQMLLEWSRAHPGANPEDTQTYIGKAAKLVLDGMTPSDDFSGTKYGRAPGMQETIGSNPYLANPQPLPAQPVAPATRAQQGALPTLPYSPTGSDQRLQWFNTPQSTPDDAAHLSDPQRQALQDDAQSRGLTLDRRIWEFQQQVAHPITANPPASTQRPAQGQRSDAGGLLRGLIPQANAAELPTPQAAPQGSAPVVPTSGGGPAAASGTPANFDMALGDSIAVQQLRHGVPGKEGVRNGDQTGATAVIGDSPNAILQRIQGMDPASFAGKNIFLSPGTSNDPSQLGAVSQQLDALKAAGAANVAIPGVGPGILNQQAINQQLRQTAEDHGYTFVAPSIRWQPDGVHPSEVDGLRNQALAAVAGTQAIRDTAASAYPEALQAIQEGRVQRRTLADMEDAISQARTSGPYTGAPYTMAALQGDPRMAHILDFIAGGVPGNTGGESDGNYNAVIGNAHSTEDLSKMTLSQVYQLQRQLVDRGLPSSAVGRYQFIGPTLRSLATDAGVDPTTTKFTPELQDRFAVQLLKRRGYDAWAGGSLSDQQFAHNLSEEWASLPDPAMGGKSHYDGVGPNHAGTSLGAVGAALTAAKGMATANTP